MRPLHAPTLALSLFGVLILASCKSASSDPPPSVAKTEPSGPTKAAPPAPAAGTANATAAAQTPAKSGTAKDLEIPHEKFTLGNGLQVILHEDHSDPIVAVYISYHVGSGREEPGRSGFAHLFEHMLFQGSQHVGDDQHFKMVSEAGGTLNGTTNTDRTLYFESLPSNQLELALWLEADRMGFLLPAVTQPKLDNQRDVVKNERRQNYENRPYGQAEERLAAALYPSDHPYSWVTIGSMKDLSAASLEDVHNFFRRWYGPNNATLAIGGDINPAEAKKLVEKYFGSIAAGPQVDPPAQRPAKLDRSVRLAMEDKVQLPQLIVVWPGASQTSEDEAALRLLASALAQGKSSILERAFRLDEPLARNVSANSDSREIAGEFRITITAAPGVPLEKIENKLREVLAKTAREGIPAETIARLKTRSESQAVRRFETVSSKTSSLCNSNCFYGDPNHAAHELAALLAVTPAQVTAALDRYLVGKPNLAMSVVPDGKLDLAATGRSKDQVVAEAGFERGKRPASGARPGFRALPVWHDRLGNGIAVVGTRFDEIPLTTLSLSVPAGHLRETPDKLGLASLTATLLNEGTKKRSTTELAEALDALGATLNVGSDDEEITFTLSVLNKNLKPAVEILREVILEPRFDAKDFERIKRQRLTEIDTRGERITSIARAAWARILYGDASLDGLPSTGTRATIDKLALADVKGWYDMQVKPEGGRLSYVGNLDSAAVRELLAPITSAWKGKGPVAVDAVAVRMGDGDGGGFGGGKGKTKIFFVDKPGAAQSEVRIGHLSVPTNDPDHYALTVLNYVLGGAFSSRINMNLREAKGYTYGARSAFEGGLRPAPFTASGGIHTQYTKESIVEFLKEIRAILDGVTDEELAFAKNALAQGQALRYESAMARLGLVGEISKYGFPDDFLGQRLAQLEKLSSADMKALAAKHLHPDSMAILVVGDKAKVLDGLKELAKANEWGDPVELDVDGAQK